MNETSVPAAPTTQMPSNEAAPPSAPEIRATVRPTLEGFGWLLISMLLLYQGWFRGINLVALLASALLTLWIFNFYLVWRRRDLRKLTLRRKVREAVFAGQPFLVDLEVENTTNHDLLALRIQDEWPQPHGWFIGRLKRGEHRSYFYRAMFPFRGRQALPTLLATTGYPFGLVRRNLQIDPEESVVVLPRLGTLHANRLRRLLLSQSAANASTRRPIRRHPGAQTEFYGLREFRNGDSPRWIHWRTSARVGELMVREFEEPPVDHLVLLVEPWLPQPRAELLAKLQQVRRENRDIIQLLLASGPPPPPQKRKAKEEALARKEEPFRAPLVNLEMAICLAATICWEWCRQSGARLALGIAGTQSALEITETGSKQVYRLLEQLALAEGTTQPDHQTLVPAMQMRHLPPGPVLLVSTTNSGLDRTLSDQLRRPVVLVDVRDPSLSSLFRIDGADRAASKVMG